MEDLGVTGRWGVAVRAVKLAALALLLATAVVLGLTRVLDQPSAPPVAAAAAPGGAGTAGATEPLLVDACSRHGLDPAETSGTDDVVALVRGPRGAVQPVPFAHGWEVFQGERPGTLVAVCRARS